MLFCHYTRSSNNENCSLCLYYLPDADSSNQSSHTCFQFLIHPLFTGRCYLSQCPVWTGKRPYFTTEQS